MLTNVIVKNFKSNLRNYLLFFLSNTLAVALLLVFSGLKYNLSASIHDEVSAYVMNFDFLTATVMLSVVAVFLTVYAVRNYVKLRIRDYSMLTVLGIRKRIFQRIIFAEYGLGWLLSVVAGLLCGNAVYYSYQKILLTISPQFLSKSLIGVKPYLYTIGISFVVVVAVVLATLIMMDGKNLATYAAGKEVQEVKPKNGKWLIFVFAGVILWGVGNWRFHIGDLGPYTAQILWLIAAFFIMCIGGSIFLEGLKKREKIYLNNVLRLNQLYHHFSSNYMIVYMLFILHFFAVGYLGNGIAGSMPLSVDKSLYPYDYIWSAQEKDLEFARKITKDCNGSIKEIPIVKVATYNGINEFGISQTIYEELTGEKCDLKENEIMAVMENGKNDKENEGAIISDEMTIKLFKTLHLGKFRGEFVIPNQYEANGYRKVNVKKIIPKTMIGQMVNGYCDSWIIFPNKVFEEAREHILNDPEEPSTLVLFQIPEKHKAQTEGKLNSYIEKNGVEEFGRMQSISYSTDKIIDGIENRNLFQFSSKIFIVIALLISSIFILKMKAMSEANMTVRRYSFLNSMGMRRKKRIHNIRFEIRSIALVSLTCGLFMGVDYAILNWDSYRIMGEELPVEYWKMWGIVTGIYLTIQILGMEWTARSTSRRVEKKIEEGGL